MSPAYNSSNGNQLPYIYDNPGAPYPSLDERDMNRASLLRRMFGMPKLELTVDKSNNPDTPRVRVEVDATPEEMVVATAVGARIMNKVKGFLRFRSGR